MTIAQDRARDMNVEYVRARDARVEPNLVAKRQESGVLLPRKAAISRERFLICQLCPDAVGAGTECRHHKGCCFGAWRSNKQNRCAIGKW